MVAISIFYFSPNIIFYVACVFLYDFRDYMRKCQGKMSFYSGFKNLKSDKMQTDMKRFGQYILLEKIAYGGMAELFKAKK